MRHHAKFAAPLSLLLAALCFPQSESMIRGSLPESNEIAETASIVSNSIFPAIVAKVNGEEIYGRELEELVRLELRSIGSPEWKNLRSEYRAELALNKITTLINSRLLYQEAKASGVKAPEAEVRAELLRLRKAYKSEAEMDVSLAIQGKDRASLEKSLRENLIASKYLDAAVNKKIVVLPEEVEKYYGNNREQFRHPDIVRTSQILIKISGENSEQDAAARKRAEGILFRLNKGENFAKLAGQYSEDPSASTGGDIGFSTKEALLPEYAEAASTLPVGGITIIRTLHGYHIVKVTDRRKEGHFTLDDLKPKLVEFLKNQKSQEELEKLIARLREKANIEILVSARELLNP